MRADLHLHSVYSDGLHRPAELAAMAKSAGLQLFSVTDHDNMGGAEEGAAAARALGLHFVRGWEVSSYEGTDKIHILGYGCRTDEVYRAFLKERFEGGRIRAEKMVRLANEFYGVNVTMDDVEAYHVRKDTPLHTMHVVRAFGEKLHRDAGPLYGEAFAFGGPAFAGECRPTPFEAVGVIHRTGGIAVLAHPGRIFCLTAEEMKRWRETDDERIKEQLDAAGRVRRIQIMEKLADAGLDGIECIYTRHTAIETEEFLAFAAARHLYVTGGSDFHAEGASALLGQPPFDADAALTERLLGLEGSV